MRIITQQVLFQMVLNQDLPNPGVHCALYRFSLNAVDLFSARRFRISNLITRTWGNPNAGSAGAPAAELDSLNLYIYIANRSEFNTLLINPLMPLVNSFSSLTVTDGDAYDWSYNFAGWPYNLDILPGGIETKTSGGGIIYQPTDISVFNPTTTPFASAAAPFPYVDGMKTFQWMTATPFSGAGGLAIVDAGFPTLLKGMNRTGNLLAVIPVPALTGDADPDLSSIKIEGDTRNKNTLVFALEPSFIPPTQTLTASPAYVGYQGICSLTCALETF